MQYLRKDVGDGMKVNHVLAEYLISLSAMTLQIPTPRCQLEKMSRMSTCLITLCYSLLSVSKTSGEYAPKLFPSLALTVGPL